MVVKRLHKKATHMMTSDTLVTEVCEVPFNVACRNMSRLFCFIVCIYRS